MWFITYNDSNSNNAYIEKIFNSKIDAFKFTKDFLYGKNYLEVLINNGDTTLISPDIKVGACLKIHLDNETINYGIISDISDYLVSVEKSNCDVVEFTKSRINKEYIKGTFTV